MMIEIPKSLSGKNRDREKLFHFLDVDFLLIFLWYSHLNLYLHQCDLLVSRDLIFRRRRVRHGWDSVFETFTNKLSTEEPFHILQLLWTCVRRFCTFHLRFSLTLAWKWMKRPYISTLIHNQGLEKLLLWVIDKLMVNHAIWPKFISAWAYQSYHFDSLWLCSYHPILFLDNLRNRGLQGEPKDQGHFEDIFANSQGLLWWMAESCTNKCIINR